MPPDEPPAMRCSSAAIGTRNRRPILMVGISPRSAALYEALRLRPKYLCPASGTDRVRVAGSASSSIVSCFFMARMNGLKDEIRRRHGRRQRCGIERALRLDRLFALAPVHFLDRPDAHVVVLDKPRNMVLQELERIVETFTFGARRGAFTDRVARHGHDDFLQRALGIRWRCRAV